MNDTDYQVYIEQQIDLYTSRARSNMPPSLDEIIDDLAPGHRLNNAVRSMVRMWGHTESQFDRAMEKAVKQARREAKNLRVATDLGGLPNGAEEFVEMYTVKHQVSITYQGKIIGAGRAASISLPRKLRLERNRLGLPLNDQAVSDGFGEWMEKQKEKRLDKLKDLIEHLPEGAVDDHRAKLAQLCEQFFETSSQFPALVAADIIRKFMWQTKRKMFGIPVTRHMMVVLVGRQDDGKTTFVKRMTTPLAEVRAAATFADLANEKIIGLWRNFIVTMDEMPYAGRTDTDIIKNVVTAEFVSRRTMKTNDLDEFENCTTEIGTTNYSLRELIYDTTGMRRFIELPTRFGIGQAEWDLVNAFDWLGLWQSVDHHADDPVDEWRDLIKDKQEGTRNLDPVEEWLAQIEARSLFGTLVGAMMEVEAYQLYTECRDWMAKYFPNLKPISVTKFGLCMARFMERYKITKEKKGGKFVYGFPVEVTQAMSQIEELKLKLEKSRL